MSRLTRLSRRSPAAPLAALLTAGLLALTACSSDGGGTDSSSADSESGSAEASDAGSTDAASTDQAAGEPVSGGTLRYLHNIEPPTWDTSRNPGLALNSIHSSLFANLVSQKPDGGYEPWLATDWTVSDDNLTYTFNLRQDVTFHDGTPFNAAAVVANLDRVFVEGSDLNPPFAQADYKATGDYSVEITLPQPNAVFIHALSTPHWSIISPAVLAEHTSAEIGEDPTLLVGTGPFKVAEYSRGSEIVLERFDDYNWAPASHGRNGPAYLDRVEISFVTEPFTRVSSLESGQVDAIDAVPPLDTESLESGGFAVLEAANSGFPYSVQLNVNVPPFDDIKVREAFRAAVNIDGLLQGLYAGRYDKAWTTTTPVTPPLGSYDESQEGTWGYDLDLANTLLDEAGWTERDSEGYRTKDGERLTLQWKDDAGFIQQDQRLQLGEGIIASVKDAGIEIVRTQYDSSAYPAELAKNTHHLAPSSRGYADVRTSAAPLVVANDPRTPGGTINYGLLDDPQIEQWYQVLSVESDPAVRIDASHKIQQLVNEQVYAVPLYVPKKIVATSQDVHGWLFDAVGYTDTFYNVWLSK